jgi:malic enzyme
VYTPTVAQGCQFFSKIYRRPRGLLISYPLRDQIAPILRSRPNREVDGIAVTDGERILGIGDQGVGGLGIPIRILSLYTLTGGIAPEHTLPTVLNLGTNNQELLRDLECVGWRRDELPTFNDDIQGTAASGALLRALRASGGDRNEPNEQLCARWPEIQWASVYGFIHCLSPGQLAVTQ